MFTAVAAEVVMEEGEEATAARVMAGVTVAAEDTVAAAGMAVAEDMAAAADTAADSSAEEGIPELTEMAILHQELTPGPEDTATVDTTASIRVMATVAVAAVEGATPEDIREVVLCTYVMVNTNKLCK